MKKDLHKRLKSYSLAAGAVVAAGSAKGQVIYTDVNPDVTKTIDGEFYDLDLNNDATVDFKINLNEFSFIYPPYFSLNFNFIAMSVYGSNEVAISYTSSYALALNQNSQIGPPLVNWQSSYAGLAGVIRSTSTSSFGNWNNVTDKYLGLKLVISGQTHYGWARLDVNTVTGSFTIKDYAYNSVAFQSIKAGALAADTAKNVMASDVGENSNGTDLQITFDKAANELTVGEYHLMVVKSSKAATFDLLTAQAVAAANYKVVVPTGSNIVTTFGSGNDTDGDPIVIGSAYKVFVLSQADGVNAFDDVLSKPSNEITLNTTAAVAFNITASDVGNKLNSEDFEVSFSKAVNETGISEYKVIVVKTAEAAGFNTVAAQSVAIGNYTSILPSGSNIQQTLAAGAKDKNGDNILVDTPYKYFVLSIANGTNANIDNLSAESNEVTLSNTIGINELSDSDVKIYTNGQLLTIDMGKTTFQNSNISIIDAAGRILIQKQLIDQKTQIDLNDANGIYVVALEADGKLMRKKVLINR